VTVNLKIEILKVFSLEFNLSSDKELKLKRDKQDAKEPVSAPPSSKQPATSK